MYTIFYYCPIVRLPYCSCLLFFLVLRMGQIIRSRLTRIQKRKDALIPTYYIGYNIMNTTFLFETSNDAYPNVSLSFPRHDGELRRLYKIE